MYDTKLEAVFPETYTAYKTWAVLLQFAAKLPRLKSSGI